MLDAMDHRMTALERAFQLARSGKVSDNHTDFYRSSAIVYDRVNSKARRSSGSL